MHQGAQWPVIVRGTLAVAAVSAIGCARQPPPPVAPATAQRPVDVQEPGAREPLPPPVPQRTVEVAEEVPASDFLAVFAIDPILTSREAWNNQIEERVDWWMSRWRTRAREEFGRGLARMGSYEDFVASELAARSLPPSLLYLPLIEANYYATAVSPVGAGGLWQFMPRTARWLGLTVNSLIDQRFDAFAATPVALDYLLDLNEQFHSWFLTLAAYNAGPGRVEQVIRRHGRGHPRDDQQQEHRHHNHDRVHEQEPGLLGEAHQENQPVRAPERQEQKREENQPRERGGRFRAGDRVDSDAGGVKQERSRLEMKGKDEVRNEEPLLSAVQQPKLRRERRNEKEERPGQSLDEEGPGAFRLLDHRPQDALHEPTLQRRRVRAEVVEVGGSILVEPDLHHRVGLLA